MATKPNRTLVTFPNPAPQRDYWIRHECPEYTAVCPVTGQPDFGTIIVQFLDVSAADGSTMALASVVVNIH